MKVEWRKQYKDIYIPKQKPTIVELESMKYITIEYLGNPNNEEFSLVMEALYGLSYSVKMKSKQLDNYYDYTIFPLEGEWDLIDRTQVVLNKDNFKARVMIRQPEFLSNELFEDYQKSIYKKKNNPYVLDAKLETIEEGLCLQMLHLGSYDSEPLTFQIMDDYLKENNYQRIDLGHKEIYLSDPNKTSEDKLKTVLRYKIKATE